MTVPRHHDQKLPEPTPAQLRRRADVLGNWSAAFWALTAVFILIGAIFVVTSTPAGAKSGVVAPDLAVRIVWGSIFIVAVVTSFVLAVVLGVRRQALRDRALWLEQI